LLISFSCGEDLLFPDGEILASIRRMLLKLGIPRPNGYLADFGHFLQRLPCLYFLQQSFFLSKEERSEDIRQPAQECIDFDSLFTLQINTQRRPSHIPFSVYFEPAPRVWAYLCHAPDQTGTNILSYAHYPGKDPETSIA
jgi:hypothetical protein